MAQFEPTTSAFGRRAVTRAQIEAQIAVKQARGAARAGEAGQGGAVHKWTLLRTLSEIRYRLGVSDRALGVLSALLSFHPETALTLAPDAARETARGERAAAGPGGRALADGGGIFARSRAQGRNVTALASAGAGAGARRASLRGDEGGGATAHRVAAPADDIHDDARDGPSDQHADLVVFPSNRALCLRANGMSEATLRRHLSALVEAGLIIRRDSPNGKRFARRDEDGEGFAQAFGFDLAPLVARASEFERQAEALRAEQRRARLLKERINLLRRDLTKRLAFALDEDLSGPWDALRQTFLSLCTPLRKLRCADDFLSLAFDLERLQDEISAALEQSIGITTPAESERVQTPIGDGAHSGRRISESNTNQISDSDPASKEAGSERQPLTPSDPPATKEIPLGLVLEACPDIRDYEFSGQKIETWRAFADLAAAVRPMLGISPDAWREACDVMGEKDAATAVAFILQRCEHSSQAVRVTGPEGRTTITVNGSPAIRSPGGYLRALTEQSKAEPRSLWSAILGQLAQKGKARSLTSSLN